MGAVLASAGNKQSTSNLLNWCMSYRNQYFASLYGTQCVHRSFPPPRLHNRGSKFQASSNYLVISICKISDQENNYFYENKEKH